MTPLVPPTGPLQGGEIVVGVAMMVIGVLCNGMFLRRQFAHPPAWVRTYKGGSSAFLGLPYGGVFLICGPLVTLLRNVAPWWILGLLSLAAAAGALLYLFSWFIWFPWFLLPGWYRRAKRAGVDVHEPASVEAFRQLPKAEQQARVAQAHEVRVRLPSR